MGPRLKKCGMAISFSHASVFSNNENKNNQRRDSSVKSISILFFSMLFCFSQNVFAKSGMPTMEMPVDGEVHLLSELGEPRSGGRKHQGIDIGAKMGTPVVAAWSGIVTKTGKGGKGGWAVHIEHAKGFNTYYAHLKSRPVVSVGEEVEQGQIVGYVGMSGNAKGTTPHLHFEVHNGTKLVNPLSYLSSM